MAATEWCTVTIMGTHPFLVYFVNNSLKTTNVAVISLLFVNKSASDCCPQALQRSSQYL